MKIVLGIVLLMFGGLIYLSSPAGGSPYFKGKLGISDSFSLNISRLLEPLRGPLPEFIHPLAFSLIGMGLFARTRRSRIWICFIFFSINILFELGQFSKNLSTRIVPGWFTRIPVLENTQDYFLKGTFSVLDLWAICLAIVVAYICTEGIGMTKGDGNEAIAAVD
jgi:hypothetical protein